MKPVSVLLVDDNPLFLRIAERFLQEDGEVVVVGTATGGEEALAQAQRLQPQVILVDLAMRGLSGLDTIPRLRRTIPEAGIIALTLLDTGIHRQAAFAAGADDFIPKTAMNTDLVPSIRRAIESNEATRRIADTAPPIQAEGSRTAPRVLVMEDDLHLRRLFSKTLSKAGYQVYPAATLDAAGELLAQLLFDVILIDMHMGDDLGTNLLREQKAALELYGTQVIIVSGEAQYRAECEEMGVDFYLEKPVALETLLTLVQRLTAQPPGSSTRKGLNG